jgi:hypothetical protein
VDHVSANYSAFRCWLDNGDQQCSGCDELIVSQEAAQKDKGSNVWRKRIRCCLFCMKINPTVEAVHNTPLLNYGTNG